MKKIVFIFCMIGCSVALWGQRGQNLCNITLESARLMVKHHQNRQFNPPANQILNLANTYNSNTQRNEVLLELVFNKLPGFNGEDRGRVIVYMEHRTETTPIPYGNGNYPDGYNIDKWRGGRASSLPTSDGFAHGGERFGTRNNEPYYRIAIRMDEMNPKGQDYDKAKKDYNYKKGNNPALILFEINPNSYNENFNMYASSNIQRKGGQPCPSQESITANHLLDLIRPTLVAPADQTIDLNSSVDIPIDAKDKYANGTNIAQRLKQNAPTNPKDVRHGHINTGVFTQITKIEKFENGAWEVMIDETNPEEPKPKIPRGLYINQSTQKLEGTAEEEGVFKIYLKTTDVAGNENSGGTGTPLNYRVPDISFILTIQQQAQIYANPGMRMRVAQ